MDNEYIIEMLHITKRFPGIVANDDVTIQIKKGEIYALLGENGAGKSTLMSVLFGMYEPDEGEIYVRGQKVKIDSPSAAAALSIGMVHQHFTLVSDFTIAENIVLGTEPMGQFGILPMVDLRKAEQEIRDLSVKYGLEVDPRAVIENVGVSVQQRVEILKMLYREAEILIFDEPTAVLTPQEIDSLLGIIRNLRDSGKTIILITHKLDEIKRVADRCAILRRGKLIDVRDVAGMDTNEIASLMVGAAIDLELEKTPSKPKRTVLDVQHLTVADRSGFEVVQDVSLQIREGEILAIAGVSGNGQTEIADAIAGLLPVKSGEIRLLDEDITGYGIRERALKGISYIPEDRHNVGLILDFSLGANLGLRRYFKEPFTTNLVLNKGVFRKYADKLIEKYDIRSSRKSETVVRSMSGGNQQKVIIGREIEEENALIIFVQPTRGLDIGAIKRIHNSILRERDKGKAILLISLELDEVMDLADTIAVIYSGRIGKTAPASEFTKQEVGTYMMGVGGRKDKKEQGGEENG